MATPPLNVFISVTSASGHAEIRYYSLNISRAHYHNTFIAFFQQCVNCGQILFFGIFAVAVIFCKLINKPVVAFLFACGESLGEYRLIRRECLYGEQGAPREEREENASKSNK